MLERWPNGSPWLFPGIMDNPEGTRPYAHASLSHQLGPWQKKIGLHDESGRPVRIHAHQFRHTFATRMINSGLEQYVVQQLLTHASPRMTARYAQIHDHTVRDAFERYCAQRVNTGANISDTTLTLLPRTPSGSSTTWPASETACPTVIAAGLPNKTAPTPTPVSPARTFRPPRSSWTSIASRPRPTGN